MNQNTHFVANNYPHLESLVLADDSQDGNKKVDILIGKDYYYHFIYGNVIKGKLDEPVALESCFGWIISGYYKKVNKSISANFNSTHMLRVNTEVTDVCYFETLNSQENPFYSDNICEKRINANDSLQDSIQILLKICYLMENSMLLSYHLKKIQLHYQAIIY